MPGLYYTEINSSRCGRIESFTAKKARKKSAAQPCHHFPYSTTATVLPPTADCSRLYLFYYLNIMFPIVFNFHVTHSYILLRSCSFIDLPLTNTPSIFPPFPLLVSSVFLLLSPSHRRWRAAHQIWICKSPGFSSIDRQNGSLSWQSPWLLSPFVWLLPFKSLCPLFANDWLTRNQELFLGEVVSYASLRALQEMLTNAWDCPSNALCVERPS